MHINIHNILHDDNPVMKQRSKDVPLPLSQEDEELLRSMIRYVQDSQDDDLALEQDLQPSIGIAAIQVGVPKKLIAVSVDGQSYALANPKIVSRSVQKSYLRDGEGCLSVKDEHPGYAYRNARITVKGFDLLQNQPVTIEADGLLSICLQHEIDHLSGKFFYNRISDTDPFFEDPQALSL